MNKISPFQNFTKTNNNRVSIVQTSKQNHHSTKKSNKNKIITTLLIGLPAVAIAGYYLINKTNSASKIIAKELSDKGFKILNKAEKAELSQIFSSVSKYPNDIEYKKLLANGLSKELNFTNPLDPIRFSSIVGPDELKEILSKLNYENYSVGENLNNVKNGIFRANLHIHTNYSDGHTSVENLLNQATKYADKLYEKTKEKFLFTITDHDTITGTKEAIKLIAQDPIKYKNLKFVAGVEKSFTMPYSLEENGNPTKLAEFLAYSFNPFSENINKAFSELQENRRLVTEKIFTDVNSALNVSDLSVNNLIPKNKAILGNSHWLAYEKAKKMFPENENIIKNITLKYRPFVENGEIIYPQNIKFEHNLDEAMGIFDKENLGMLSFAHPAYLVANKNKNISFDSMFDVAKKIFQKFNATKSNVTRAFEGNYQGYQDWIINQSKPINKFFNELTNIKTGGIDNHNNNIFTNTKIDKLEIEELI